MGGQRGPLVLSKLLSRCQRIVKENGGDQRWVDGEGQFIQLKGSSAYCCQCSCISLSSLQTVPKSLKWVCGGHEL